MKKSITLFIFVLAILPAYNQIIKTPQIKVPRLKWESIYVFDKSNSFKVDFYAKNNELMRSLNYKTYFQAKGENFSVKMLSEKGNGVETVFDKKNEVAIQIWGSGGNTKPYYNAGGFKYPTDTELKKLEIVPTNESKLILGYKCRKFTYTYKKIFGEVWITDQVTLSNDYGIFRAAKMAALHNTLSMSGFVIEMTTEDAKGGKTVMQTTSLNNSEKYSISFDGVDMNTAINKVNYFSF